MCGIVGYIGKSGAEKELVTLLKNLEYRGYDSAGVAVQLDGDVSITKASGKIANLESVLNVTEATTGIAHTRWATHGKPTETNAHPHTSANGEWVVVHNGIIENFEELKKEIRDNSQIKFVSETDTEVVPQLLQLLDGDSSPMDNFINTCSRLAGSYAVACLNKKIKDTLFLARKKSPLYVAKTDSEVIVASDPICFVGKSREYYMLNEEEFCQVSVNNIEFYNKNKEQIGKNTIELTGIEENFGKQDFDHFMLKEIYEIPSVLNRIVKTYSDNNVFEKINSESLQDVNKIIIIGCGTAYHAGLMGAKYIEKLARIETHTYVASEFRYTDPIIDKNTLCIFVSQSGETADTLAAQSLVQSIGCKTIALTNVLYSSLAKSVDIIFPVCAGPEIAVASTKAYNAQITILYMFAKHLQNLKFNMTTNYISQIDTLAKDLTLPCIEDIKEFAQGVKVVDKAFFIGRDRDYITAEEASLKLKEITYINSSAYPSGELKHGFLALIDEGTYLFVIATEKDLLDKTLNGAHEAYARGAKVVLVTQLDVDNSKFNFVHKTFKLQNFDEDLMPIVSIITLQMISYFVSILKDINPDQPRNLAKSVTVE